MEKNKIYDISSLKDIQEAKEDFKDSPNVLELLKELENLDEEIIKE